VSLEYLMLSENLLESIPSSVGSIVSLKKLFLHENLLCRIPRELS
jgi:Leucine-rich repeat (LRR) protein